MAALPYERCGGDDGSTLMFMFNDIPDRLRTAAPKMVLKTAL